MYLSRPQIYQVEMKNHSANFIHYCMDIHKDRYQAGGLLEPGDKYFVLSDGAPTHLKIQGNFQYVSNYELADGGVCMVWRFFQYSHGKGKWDGEGTTVKHGI